jgi:hypothetical protein
MTASDRSTAETALYQSVGGTPAEIGQALVDEFERHGDAYHKTADGSSPTLEKVIADTRRSELTVYWRHPKG